MRHVSLAYILIAVLVSFTRAQVTSFPYLENFDGTTAPSVPAGWSLSGFTVSSSGARSVPNCLYAVGDIDFKKAITPYCNLSLKKASKLTFWEKRSSTAVSYCLEVRASTDGDNFDFLLASFDTINSTSSYVQRVVDLEPIDLRSANVKFQILIVSKKTNNTGVLRIDDFCLTVATMYDIKIESISVLPPFPTRGEPFKILTTVKNTGLEPANNFAIRFFLDQNMNDFPEAEEELTILSDLSLQPNDSVTYSIDCTIEKPDKSNLISVSEYLDDENSFNDTIRANIYVGCKVGDIVINEIMYAPLSEQCEWVELYNTSEFPVNLASWKIHDNPTKSGVNTYTISDNSIIIKSNSYAVIAGDSSILNLFPYLALIDSGMCLKILNRSTGLSLNNDGDAVVLKDLNDKMIDSVYYFPAWHNPNFVDVTGRSLEKINPCFVSTDGKNWSTCVEIAGGTPGKQNSVFTNVCEPEFESGVEVLIAPNPFSPDGDGFEDFCIISYELQLVSPVITAKIYDIKGRLIRTLVNSEVASSKGNLVWDGLSDNRRSVRVGVYILLFEAFDSFSKKNYVLKKSLVIASRF